MNITPTREQVLAALSNVQDPDLKKDLVSLNMIDKLVIDEKTISFTVLLTTPACPLKEYLRKACTKAVEKIAPGLEIIVNMASKPISAGPKTFENIKNIILVSAAKGGVGKSTVASNLAAGLAHTGAKVGLLDADVYGPSIPLMFGKQGTTTSVAPSQDGKPELAPVEAHGVKIISMGFLIRPEQAVSWRGPMISSMVKQFIDNTKWGELDYLIIDMPPGTGDIQLTICQYLPVTGALIVTTPQKVASDDVLKGISMFMLDTIKVNIIGIVENMAYYVDPDGAKHYIFGDKHAGKVLAQELGIPYICEIPIMPSVNQSCDDGCPAILNQDPAAPYFRNIVEKVACAVSVLNA